MRLLHMLAAATAARARVPLATCACRLRMCVLYVVPRQCLPLMLGACLLSPPPQAVSCFPAATHFFLAFSCTPPQVPGCLPGGAFWAMR